MGNIPMHRLLKAHESLWLGNQLFVKLFNLSRSYFCK